MAPKPPWIGAKRWRRKIAGAWQKIRNSTALPGSNNSSPNKGPLLLPRSCLVHRTFVTKTSRSKATPSCQHLTELTKSRQLEGPSLAKEGGRNRPLHRDSPSRGSFNFLPDHLRRASLVTHLEERTVFATTSEGSRPARRRITETETITTMIGSIGSLRELSALFSILRIRTSPS